MAWLKLVVHQQGRNLEALLHKERFHGFYVRLPGAGAGSGGLSHHQGGDRAPADSETQGLPPQTRLCVCGRS